MKSISNPVLRFINSAPSSLGTIDYFIVLYDEGELGSYYSTNWWKEHEFEVAEELYETAEYQGVYVIHASGTRGQNIYPLEKDQEQLAYNRINCDSILSYHCVAIKTEKQVVHLRTGFHETYPDDHPASLLFDWGSMDEVSNRYQEIEVDKDLFFEYYEKVIKVWKEKVKLPL